MPLLIRNGAQPESAQWQLRLAGVRLKRMVRMAVDSRAPQAPVLLYHAPWWLRLELIPHFEFCANNSSAQV